MASGHAPLINSTEADAAVRAIRLVSYAEFTGLVPKGPVDNNSVEAALQALASEGVARHASTVELTSAERLSEVLGDVLGAVDDSPMPHREWEPVSEILGDNLLGVLLGVSTSSIHRYRSGTRSIPDAVAARLHVVALIVVDLLGSYNDFGVRRWFGRSRSALSGRSPADVLSGAWTPDDDGTMQVRSLAASLLFPQAA